MTRLLRQPLDGRSASALGLAAASVGLIALGMSGQTGHAVWCGPVAADGGALALGHCAACWAGVAAAFAAAATALGGPRDA